MVDLVPYGYSSVSKFHECSYKDLGGSSLTAPFHFSFPLNMSALQPVQFAYLCCQDPSRGVLPFRHMGFG